MLFVLPGTVLLQACGSTIPEPVITADNYGYVRFRSNEITQITGSFSLNFEASIEGKQLYPLTSWQGSGNSEI